ncbi:sulfatase-like hydrolase/transferase, partial [Vibrio nomapromontoriensis]|uniref:sulfatase-like hydrolase/transferase n=1 Tax=Vibrio nomapromontoriensis TaxID=2910246 RepID=UPI003D117572
MSLSRRKFIKGVAGAAVTTGVATTFSASANTPAEQIAEKMKGQTVNGKPVNILIITADQLAKKGIAAYGNTVANTPAIDSIINKGTRFNSAFTAYPLCGPSRASFWTGRLPHQNGVHGNNSPDIPTTM